MNLHNDSLPDSGWFAATVDGDHYNFLVPTTGLNSGIYGIQVRANKSGLLSWDSIILRYIRLFEAPEDSTQPPTSTTSPTSNPTTNQETTSESATTTTEAAAGTFPGVFVILIVFSILVVSLQRRKKT